ncbi:MAG TPA: LemA family protein [Allosphingosinicella sp.]|nr:LemA family protein [Allosphingosinicella sp.]
MLRLRILALFAPVLLLLTACGVNSIPTAEENAKARWADVQTELQRRNDLIGNLVETVKGFARQEREVLTQVTEARANANRVTVTGDQLTDPQAMARLAEAQGRINVSLQRLQEAYPELTSQRNFESLQVDLSGTENRIGRARERYNAAVQEYNTTIRTFPAVIGARVIYGSKPMVPFEATPESQQAPKVDFSK